MTLLAAFLPVSDHCMRVGDGLRTMDPGLHLISTAATYSGCSQNGARFEQKVTGPQRQNTAAAATTTSTTVASDHMKSAPVAIPGSNVTKGVFARWRDNYSQESSPSSADGQSNRATPSTVGEFLKDFLRSPGSVNSRELNLIAPSSS